MDQWVPRERFALSRRVLESAMDLKIKVRPETAALLAREAKAQGVEVGA